MSTSTSSSPAARGGRYQVSRRRDTHARSDSFRKARRKRRYSDLEKQHGVDAEGRFIGPGDLDRACRHFWSAPHRRGAAPIVRDPIFGVAGVAKHGNAGIPRRSIHGITPEQLRALHARYKAGGISVSALAREFSLPQSAVRYHLCSSGGAGSVALRVALRSAPPTVSAAA